ncbi:MAG: amidohydrolase family protein [Chloroflexi bacterium]|nr:amidohydrolase family protein [Chloroflexota bacterium]
MQTVIRGARVFDGTGAEAVEQGAVLVDGGVVQEVGERDRIHQPSDDAAVYDFEDCTLLPGLIDSHVHLVFSGLKQPLADLQAEDDRALLLRAAHNAQIALRAGITTVKDLGGRTGLTFDLRDAIARGLLPGTRILAAGSPITTTGGHCYWLGGEADTADDVRRKVREMVRSGADLIKVMSTGGRMTAGSNVTAAQYTVEQLQAIVEDAHRLDRKVAAHGHGTAGIRNAVAAGVDCIEHCNWVSGWASDEVEYDFEVAREMARKRIFMDPTLSPHDLHSSLDPSEWTPNFYEGRKIRPKALEGHRQSIEAGVEIACGTDAGVSLTPLDTLPHEIGLLHSLLGLSPAQAIRAATWNAARSAGKERELGSLQPGRRADVLVVEGNPLENLDDLRKVRAVFKDGLLEVENGRLVRC